MRVSGDDAPVDDRGATPVALVFHELATNAAKYGALSVPAGAVEVGVRLADGMIDIDWREAGGPPVAGEPTRLGFGTRLAQMSIEQQLGGRFTRQWRPEGLCVEVSVLAARLSREA